MKAFNKIESLINSVLFHKFLVWTSPKLVDGLSSDLQLVNFVRVRSVMLGKGSECSFLVIMKVV